MLHVDAEASAPPSNPKQSGMSHIPSIIEEVDIPGQHRQAVLFKQGLKCCFRIRGH
jgi:hypothetical protein